MLKSHVIALATSVSIACFAGNLGAQTSLVQDGHGKIAFSTPTFGLGPDLDRAVTTASAKLAPKAKIIPKKKPKKPTAGKRVIFTQATGSAWLHSDVPNAWGQGYRGRGASITVVDNFNNNFRIRGTLGSRTETLSHGAWTRKEASMVATDARMVTQDFSNGSKAVKLQSGFNVMNLSYGVYTSNPNALINWGRQEASMIGYADQALAVVVKAAGNDSVAVGTANDNGRIDVLSRDLTGLQTAIFVGALSNHGTTSSPARLASYSNFAGTDEVVQNQFLVVGVKSSATGLSGTSFAAPIISGYAAILRSKFTTATPAQITAQLLGTARQDTVNNYDPAVHGRGEASLSRALAPSGLQ